MKTKKILLVCLDNLGDLVFTTGAYRSLLADQSQSNISIWCKDYTKQIAGLFPGEPPVYASDPFWDKAPGQRRGSFWAFVRTLRQIRRQRFDCALIVTKQWRCALAVALIGIPVRIGYAHGKSKWFLTKAIEATKQPSVLQHATLALAAGAKQIHHTYSLQGRFTQAKTLLEKRYKLNQTVVLHAFAGHARRCWSLSNWLLFAEELRAKGFDLIWIGQKEELQVLREQLDAKHHKELLDSIPFLAGGMPALLAHASLFIGHDSGPLHLAHSFGAKVLGFYLPGEPERTMPQGEVGSVMIARSSPQDLSLADALNGFDALIQSENDIAKMIKATKY